MVKIMAGTLLLAVLVTGLCVSLAVHSLMEARLSRVPGLDEATVRHFGVFPSLLLVAFCGPVLVLREWRGLARRPVVRALAARSAALALTTVWAASIGLVAIGLGGHVVLLASG